MKTIKSIVFVLLVTSGIGAQGQTANLEFGTGTPTTPQTISVLPGSTFSTTLYLTTSFIPSGSGALTFDLLASNSDFLSLTSRDYVGSGNTIFNSGTTGLYFDNRLNSRYARYMCLIA